MRNGPNNFPGIARHPCCDFNISDPSETPARTIGLRVGERYDEALGCCDRGPCGDEQNGSSSVATSELADVVEAVIPGLMRVITASAGLAGGPAGTVRRHHPRRRGARPRRRQKRPFWLVGARGPSIPTATAPG